MTSSRPLCLFVAALVVYGLTTAAAVRSPDGEVVLSTAEALAVPVVAFGHVHVPRLIPLDRDRTFVDTGTWAPMTSFGERGRARPGYHNVLLVRFEAGRACVSLTSSRRPFFERRKRGASRC